MLVRSTVQILRLLFHGFFALFGLCHLCPAHKINAQTPITAILSTYLLHGLIVNVSAEWIDLKGNRFERALVLLDDNVGK